MSSGEDWTNSATEVVLKLLDECDVALSPGAITLNLELRLERPPSQATVTRALRGLRERGLIEKPDEDRTYYRITETGRAFLSGELEGQELDADEE